MPVFFFFTPLLFIIGITCGSFLNVVIDRLPNGESFILSRSHCDFCNKRLSWYDLIPLVSYVSLHGKCRYCHKPINSRMFFVEMFTGISFTFLAFYSITDFSNILFLKFILLSCLLFILIPIFMIDLKYNIIPDELLIAMGVIVSFIVIFFYQSSLIEHFSSGIISFLLFLLIYLGTKERGMGFGDVKFSFLIGFFLGFPAGPIAFYVAFLTGAIISLILVVLGKKKLRGGVIPFGPFLVIGIIIAYFLTNNILLLMKL